MMDSALVIHSVSSELIVIVDFHLGYGLYGSRAQRTIFYVVEISPRASTPQLIGRGFTGR